MPMTPDEVGKVLKHLKKKTSTFSPYVDALSFALRILGRVNKECLEKFLYKFNDDNRKELFVTCSRTTTRYPIQYKKDIKYLSQAIVTYLGGEK
jgi:hypothetical protein